MGYKKQVWICITETPPNNVWKTFLTEWVCWVRWEINTPGSEERNNWDVPVSYQFPTFSETSFQTRLGWTCHAQQQICLQGILQWPSQGSTVCPHLTLGIQRFTGDQKQLLSKPSFSGCVTDVWSSDRIQLSCSADDTAHCVNAKPPAISSRLKNALNHGLNILLLKNI